MQIVATRTGDHLDVVVQCERLDASVSPQFKRQVGDEITDDISNVTLDLSSVTFIDSSALGTMVSLLKMLGSRGGMTVRGVNPSVMGLFKLTRMDRVFTIEQATTA